MLSVAAAGAALAGGTAQAQAADANGCNFYACVNVTGNAGGFNINGYLEDVNGAFGHFVLTAPGVNVTTLDQTWDPNQSTAVFSSAGAGQGCAEFFIGSASGGYHSSGKACVDIT